MNHCTNCNKECGFKKYCSYSCRNIYVNINLRDYSKNKKGLKLLNENIENEYYKDPKNCLQCNSIISYESRKNKFCSSSCSATHNNKIREHKPVFTKEGIQSILNATALKFKKSIDNYNLNTKSCKECNNILTYRNRGRLFCNKKCKNDFYIKRNEGFNTYKNKTRFTFSLNKYIKEFDFNLIRDNGWYSPTNKNNNLKGVSRDHIISVKSGFKQNISPELIAHPANCQLLIHNSNIAKGKKDLITKEELEERIEIWNIIYKNK